MREIIEPSIFDYEPHRNAPEFGSAWASFAELVARPDGDIDLIEAALLMAATEYPGLNIGAYLQKIETMADDVRLLLGGETEPEAAIGVLNSYFFTTLGFHGNRDDYSDPRNSYLNDVLERKTGLPITLSLLYIELGRQAGLPLEGVGLPGHFIVRYRQHASQTFGRRDLANDNLAENEGEDILLDPFNGGQILTPEDCLELVREAYGRPVPVLEAFMRPIGPRAFLSRMLHNLRSSYIADEDYERALRVAQLLVALNPDDWDEIRDRGILHYKSGHMWQGVIDMKAYLRHEPNARDTGLIQNHVNDILREIAKRN